MSNLKVENLDVDTQITVGGNPIPSQSDSATLTNKNLDDTTTAIVDTSDATKKIIFDAAGTTGTSTTLLSSQTSNKILTFPDASDTLIGKNTTDILTNKTMSGASNTFSSIPQSAITSLTSDLALKANLASPTFTGTVTIPSPFTLGSTSITASGTEINFLVGVTSSIQTQFSNKQPLNTTLTSLAAFNSNGIIVQTAASTFTSRSIVAGSSKVSISNGDGVSGNISIDVVPVNFTGIPESGVTNLTTDLAAKEVLTNKSTSTSLGTSDTLYPSQNAVKVYVDNTVSAAVVGLLDDRGNFNASGNVFPSSGGSGTAGAILKGDLWTISVAGTLGGHAVTAGDVIRALVDTPGQTDSNWAISENNFGYIPLNSANNLSDLTSASTARTNLGLGTLATQNGTFSGTSSGSNTGDQTITLTGDVTGSGTGSFAATISANAVTNAKFRQGAALSVVGVTGNATANVADISGTANQVLRINGAGTALAFGAIDLSQSAAATGVLQSTSMPALTGDVTNTVGTLATTISNNAITDAKISSHTSTKITITTKGQLNSNIVYIDQANSFSANDQTFKAANMKIVDATTASKLLTFNNAGQSASTTLTLATNSTTSQTLNFPDITASDTITTLGLAQTITGAKTFNDNILKIRNPGNTFSYSIRSSAIGSALDITLPLITANDTFDVLGLAQTFTGAKTFGDSILLFRNPANTFSYTIRTSAITAARDLTIPLTTQNETIAVQPGVLQSLPANPTGTTSTTGLMMGLAGAFTPRVTGRVYIQLSGNLTNGTGDDGASVNLRTGTGTAPTNGAALTGTIRTGTVRGSNVTSGGSSTIPIHPFCIQAIVTGLTVGTAIWIDAAVAAITGGTASIQNLSLTAYEI